MLKKKRQALVQGLLLVLCSVVVYAEAAKLRSSPEAAALLGFQSKADMRNHLGFSENASFGFCDWQGVTCYQQKVVRLILEDLDLGGVFAPNTLSQLAQLRVLSLQNNSLTGPIPDLSGLLNLKTLFLDHNSFNGSFPLSLLSLHRIRTLDLSYNNLTGPIPTSLASLDPLYYLRLDLNRLNGTIPPLNQSSLKTFNISGNNLTGPIPVTPTLLRFQFSCFSWNPGLCGKIVHKECHPRPHFFGPTYAVEPPPPMVALGQSAEEHGVELAQPQSSSKERKTAVIIGFSTGVFVLIGSLVCFVMAVWKPTDKKQSTVTVESDDEAAAAQAAAVIQMEQENELEEKVKRVQGMQVAKSGNLIFCAGEAQLYSLDQLMRASAELLGKGTMGSTYKAVLDNRLVVTVKRLDAGKLAATTKETFEQHLESVGGLRHPNLVPLRAYFQAKQERLLIYDFQPNGSLFSLIHGSKSTREKPLHWTSCLKIAEDVAQGLSYIHQAWRLVHGNLKSSNVLLGPDFEACLSDYCLAALVTSSPDEDPDSTACKPPETRNSNQQATSKSDVFAYGVLLLELLTGKPPSQHPFLFPDEMMPWLRSCREDDVGDDERLGMLLEVAIACSLSSPEQRPTMWQVLKMLQEIKEAVLMEDGDLDPLSGCVN
ncbi:putative inactive receptor kinase [Hibiscus syriacus]|uniref:Inactive receptor kinase n=1 Tax=Hibiscus syriacus TaxID=106335 RepID=A0A6A3BP50_HIBSY|nr:probable inactive receptor kinase At5g67200 [Hibiscus syriacus]XP_039066931.1 probable inactive receptor kinase At5g67200 [Hibiscus syriacus]KAE8718115.1 putative inactive receptor kinase [Hibiscus syriacus]